MIKKLEGILRLAILCLGVYLVYTLYRPQADRLIREVKEQVFTTMELRMKCGVGKCGRCNIGSKYVCKDGPVFRFDELGELPDEY